MSKEERPRRCSWVSRKSTTTLRLDLRTEDLTGGESPRRRLALDDGSMIFFIVFIVFIVFIFFVMCLVFRHVSVSCLLTSCVGYDCFKFFVLLL